jgi:hypothetical protein
MKIVIEDVKQFRWAITPAGGTPGEPSDFALACISGKPA